MIEAAQEAKEILQSALSAGAEMLITPDKTPEQIVSEAQRIYEAFTEMVKGITGHNAGSGSSNEPERPAPAKTKKPLPASDFRSAYNIMEEYVEDMKEYDSNPVAAQRKCQKKYQDKRLTLMGIVKSIAECGDEFRIKIKNCDCTCYFPSEREDDVLKLSKGKMACVTGTWNGRGTLRDCELAKFKMRQIPVVPSKDVHKFVYLLNECRGNYYRALEKYEGQRLTVSGDISPDDVFGWYHPRSGDRFDSINFRNPMESSYELENYELKEGQEFAVVGMWRHNGRHCTIYDCELVIVQN